MYKWVDEEGNVSYSDKPPPGIKSEEIKKRNYGVTDEEAQKQLDSLTEKANALQQERDIKTEVSAQQEKRSETIKKNCDISRSNLELLTSQSRVTLKDAQGNNYFLSDQEKQSKTLDAQANVDRYCTN